MEYGTLGTKRDKCESELGQSHQSTPNPHCDKGNSEIEVLEMLFLNNVSGTFVSLMVWRKFGNVRIVQHDSFSTWFASFPDYLLQRLQLEFVRKKKQTR